MPVNRALSIESPAIPMIMGRPALEPVRLSGREGVNSLFEYELLLKTPDSLNIDAVDAADWNLDSFNGREISCLVELDGVGADGFGAGTRQINAVITGASLWGEEGRHVQYKLTLRPWLHLATVKRNCLIFQDVTVVEIVDAVLGEYSFSVDKRLIEAYPRRDYQTQMNESDWEFVVRITQENGISYFFEHSEGKHRLVLIDNMGAYKKSESAAYHQVDYHAPGWKLDAEYVHRFVPHHQLTPGRYATADYDYTRPRADLRVSRSDPRPTGQANIEVYGWHDDFAGSHYAQPMAGTAAANDPLEEGGKFALLRMQALRTHGARAEGSGNLRGMVPGCRFELQNHPRKTANIDYLILETRLLIEDVAQDSQIKDAPSGRKQQWRAEVEFTAHPMSEPLRPALTQPKPRSHGPQFALVVGPEGHDVWSDYLGRIKVQFPWDRVGRRDQHSSCWVRVASPWAGNQFGAIQLPRIGQEVLIDFIGGDPDLPICTGRIANEVNLPPWKLPDQAALSGFRSRELTPDGGNSATGRSNHLILDDTDQKIQAQLKSDHQSSSLSLGHITRIEDNEGRKDARGEGAELRSDGHVAVRGANGMLLSTEARPNAQAHMLDCGETVQRLTVAREQHEGLSASAQKAEAHLPGDQDEVTKALKAQNDAIRGHGRARDGHFPELAEPHLVLASPAGIESTTAQSTHIASFEHNALTSGGHTSVSAGNSFLVSAKNAVRIFAFKLGLKFTAFAGDIDFTALKDNIRMLAKKEIILKADTIRIEATTEFSFRAGKTYGVFGENAEVGTVGDWIARAKSHPKLGPAAKSTDIRLPSTEYLGCTAAERVAAGMQSGTALLGEG